MPTDSGGTELACRVHRGAKITERQGRARAWVQPSESDPTSSYRVTIGIDGRAVCTCPGWEHRRACKHATAAEERFRMTTQALEVMKITPPAALLPTRDELGLMADIARSVIGAAGHAVPQNVDSPAKALAIMMAGHELGVRPMTALRHMLVIGGRTEPDAQLMAAIVCSKEPDAKFEVVTLTDRSCTMRLTRPRAAVRAEYTYDLADAERAGLVKPGSNWQKFPKDMLRWAATKRLARIAAPDLINAVGSVEVATAEALMPAGEAPLVTTFGGDDFTPPAVALPAALYNEGDEPASEYDIDPETGEVLSPPLVVDEVPPLPVESPPALPAQASALGEFEDVAAFYRYCARELRLAGPRVREIAGYKAGDRPDVILGYEGGLDMLQVACGIAAALPEGSIQPTMEV